MILLLHLVSFFIPFLAFSDDYQDAMTLAKVYWDTDEVSKAKAIYVDLLQKPLHGDQEQKLQFNIAALELKERKYLSAIAALNMIVLKGSPWVQENIYYNLSSAYLEQGYKLLKEDNPNYDEAIAYFNLSVQALKNSSASRCEMEQFYGNVPCVIPEQIQAFLRGIEKEIAKLRQQNHIKREIHDKHIAVLFVLERSLKAFERNITFMRENAMSSQQKDHYQALFMAELESLQPQWLDLKKDFTASAVEKSFEKAMAEFETMKSAFADKKWDASDIALTETETTLQQLITTLAGDNLILIRLQGIARLLMKGIDIGANPNFVDSLQQEFHSLQAVSHASSDQQQVLQSIQKVIDSGQNTLNMASSLFDNDNPLGGSLFLEYTAVWVQQAIFILSQQTSNKLLQLIVDTQTFCLKLWTASKDSDSDWKNYAKEIQGLVLRNAEMFLPLVYSEQKRLFKDTGACQSSPWEEALPLFEKGRVNATKALKSMKGGASFLRDAIQYQYLALKAWKEALFLINHPETSKSSTCHGQGSSSADPSKANVQNAVELLQQMETDDRLPMITPPAIEISKPW